MVRLLSAPRGRVSRPTAAGSHRAQPPQQHAEADKSQPIAGDAVEDRDRHMRSPFPYLKVRCDRAVGHAFRPVGKFGGLPLAKLAHGARRRASSFQPSRHSREGGNPVSALGPEADISLNTEHAQ